MRVILVPVSVVGDVANTSSDCEAEASASEMPISGTAKGSAECLEAAAAPAGPAVAPAPDAEAGAEAAAAEAAGASSSKGGTQKWSTSGASVARCMPTSG